MPNPKSTASIAGHPIHPMIIPFPIAFFLSTLVCDIVFWATGREEWAAAALWLLGAGIVMALVAAVIGLIDVFGDRRIRELNEVWWHAGGNVLVVLIELYNWAHRYAAGTTAIIPVGIVLSLVAVIILVFNGWMGWEMVYRHRVGVLDAADTQSGTARPTSRHAA